MTCIATLQGRGRIWMGGDSAIVTDDSGAMTVSPDPKVSRRGGALVGVSGDCEYCDAVEAADWPDSPSEHWIRKVLPRLVSGRLGKEAEATGLAIVATSRGVYVLDDLAVYRPGGDYYAVGIGAPYAMGAFAATKGFGRPRVRKALVAASKHLPGSVQPPFRILSITT